MQKTIETVNDLMVIGLEIAGVACVALLVLAVPVLILLLFLRSEKRRRERLRELDD